MKTTVTILALLLCVTSFAAAGEKMSDAQIKQKLLGYWKSPRHAYEYTSDGIMHMLGGTTTSHWDVRNGVYYEGSYTCDIITLTNSRFVYRDRSHDHLTFTLQRISKEEAARNR
jgi:hypothetical protein